MTRWSQGGPGLAIDAQHLLPYGVRPASQKARLGRSGMALEAENAGNIHALFFEVRDQRIARVVLPHRGDGKHPRAQRGEVVGGVCASPGHEVSFAMAKDEDRRLAGDARDFTELKFVGDEIAQDGYGLGGELIDVFG